MTYIDRITICKDCGLYYSVRISPDGLLEQWVRMTEGGIWEPMPGETENHLDSVDSEYLCWMCREDKWLPS